MSRNAAVAGDAIRMQAAQVPVNTGDSDCKSMIPFRLAFAPTLRACKGSLLSIALRLSGVGTQALGWVAATIAAFMATNRHDPT